MVDIEIGSSVLNVIIRLSHFIISIEILFVENVLIYLIKSRDIRE
jgi:hypothetical protein